MNHCRIWILALVGLAGLAGAASDVSLAIADTRLESVRYRPRSGRGRAHVSESPTQLHAGFFEPDGNGTTSFAFGFRGGPAIDERVQIGLGVDWYHKSESQRVVAGDPYLVGGQIVRPTRVLSRASSDHFPILLFMQMTGGGDTQVIPYGGIAGGYEVLLLSATDYQTQQDFDATFGGWGWQAWAGAALPRSGRSRIFGEVFLNQGDVERDVTDTNGNTFRERVDADGVGMRFGLSWGF